MKGEIWSTVRVGRSVVINPARVPFYHSRWEHPPDGILLDIADIHISKAGPDLLATSR